MATAGAIAGKGKVKARKTTAKKRAKRALTRRDKIFHVVSIAFIIAALAFTFFRFELVIFRTATSIKDLLTSLWYFIATWKPLAESKMTPTVTEVPEYMSKFLPLTWSEFKKGLLSFPAAFVDRANVIAYLKRFLIVFAVIIAATAALFLILAAIIGIAFLVYRKPSKENVKTGSDTRRLKRLKRIEAKIHAKTTYHLKYYRTRFLKTWKGYKIALILIWTFNLNGFTIAIEAAAFLLYFLKSFDVLNLPLQLYKLMLDGSVALGFIPVVFQVVLGYRLWHVVRVWLGRTRIGGYIKQIAELLTAFIGTVFIVGKQRARKTTLLVVLSIIQAMVFRQTAKKAMKKRRKQFPFFPWRTLEKCVRNARDRHKVYTLATAREFVRLVKSYNERPDRIDETRCCKRLVYLKRIYGYTSSDFIFGYDVKSYPMKYDTGTTIVGIWEAIEAYARLYFIYATKTPLIFGNLSIRSDEIQKSKGGLEKYDFKFERRRSNQMKRNSQYCHIYHSDMGRLGQLMNPEDIYKNALEFGVLALMEYDKEVGNQKTQTGDKDSKKCNRKNDGHSNWLKTVTHQATVDNDTYIRVFVDGHRPESLTADVRELTTLWRIKGNTDSRIVLPFFSIEQVIWAITGKIYDWLEDKFSYLHKENTVFMYVLNKLFKPFDDFCERIKNQFSVYGSKINMWDGSDDEVLKKNARIIVPECLAFSKRFATDGLGEFFHEKALRSPTGIDDCVQFGDVKMTFDEMMEIGSHFYNEYGAYLELEAYVKAQEQLLKWLDEKKSKEKEAKAG